MNLYDSYLVFNINIKNLQFCKITLWSQVINEKKKNDKETKIINYILLSNKTKNGSLCIDISFDRIIKHCKQYDSNFKYYINSFIVKEQLLNVLKNLFIQFMENVF